MLPVINARRTYLIARRDFYGYIKTWGFWISFLTPFIFGFLGFAAANMNINVDPVRYETILDETGLYETNLKRYDEQGRRDENWRAIQSTIQIADGLDKSSSISDEKVKQARRAYLAQGFKGLESVLGDEIPPSVLKSVETSLNERKAKTQFVAPPANTIEGLKPFILGKNTIDVNGSQQVLGSVLYIYHEPAKENGSEKTVKAELWSTNVTDERLSRLARNYFRDKAQTDYLAAQGLTSTGLSNARSQAPKVQFFDPSKVSESGQKGQEVTNNDKIPFLVSVIAAVMLWLTVFSGAYMLLTSMLEEKLNKLLEMMLATTRFSEVMLGKLLGVAALTITAMLPYFIVGIAGTIFLTVTQPDIGAAIVDAVTPKLLIFFPIFLFLGYIFYGALFIALGSLAESMQDAQTLTTPIMLVLTACIFVVPLGIRSPDSVVLTFASWFPLSAPFAAIARLASDPPWWELALSAFFLFLMSILVIWLAGRIFRFGVLSGAGVKGVGDWFKRVILRRKA